MNTGIRHLSMAGVLALSFFGAGEFPAAAQTGQPLKIRMEPELHSVAIGQEVSVKCTLLDADNQPAKALKDMAVNVEAIAATGQMKNIPIIVKAGEASYDFKFPASAAGITELRAQEKELQDGSTFIKVRAPKMTPMMMMVTNAVIIPPHATPPAAVMTGTMASHLPPMATMSSELEMAHHPMMIGLTPTSAPTPAPAPAPTSAPKKGLTLRHDMKKIMADGKDAATISAFLDDDDNITVPGDITIIFDDSLGTVLPKTLVISNGQEFAETKVVSEQRGVATVEVMSAGPDVNLLSDKVTQITFGPPIIALQIQSSPVKVTMMEHADICIQLMNAKQMSETTDEPKEIELTFTGGGELSTNRATIPLNDSCIHIPFSPTHLGTVRITAWANNLPAQFVDIVVVPPTALLLSSAFGGLLGGLLAAFGKEDRRKSKKSDKLMRIGFGIITGFALYYFAVLGLLSTLIGTVVLNPFVAVFLSIIGGWMGTEVLTRIFEVLLPKKEA